MSCICDFYLFFTFYELEPKTSLLSHFADERADVRMILHSLLPGLSDPKSSDSYPKYLRC